VQSLHRPAVRLAESLVGFGWEGLSGTTGTIKRISVAPEGHETARHARWGKTVTLRGARPSRSAASKAARTKGSRIRDERFVVWCVSARAMDCILLAWVRAGVEVDASPRLACIIAFALRHAYSAGFVYDLRGFLRGASKTVSANPNYLYIGLAVRP
jgi:hypothetical protein